MFQPSIHGWPFPNEHRCTGSELGIGGPPPPELGLGGGMCWAALDRYLRGAAIPRRVRSPEAGDPLYAELVQRQVAALADVWPRVRQWQGEPDGSWRDTLPLRIPFGTDLASRTRAEWGGLKRRLKAGEPVLLTLLPRADGYHGVRSMRQVLATDWSRQGKRVSLSVYDPDRPGSDDVRLTFDLSGPLSARISGEPTVRGFFVVPYDRRPPAPLRPQSFDERSVIGLNRKVQGRIAATTGRNRIDLVARNDRGALIHFRRVGHRPWDGTNVTESEGFGASELHSDPTAIQRSGVIHAFGRSYVGDLLHFRFGRSWTVHNRTEHKGAGARFRLAGQPVPLPGPRLGLGVVGRDQGGGLVHYHTSPLRGWRAEQVPGDPVAGDPVAARDGDTVHVVAKAKDGRPLHWARTGEWAMTRMDVGPGPEVRLAGAPTLVILEGRVHVFGRSRSDELALMTLGHEGEWKRVTVGQDLAGDPVATRGPAGIHVFAPTTAGGLVHAWGSHRGWDWEDVLATRPTLRATGSGGAEAACWGSDRELRVFVRRDRTLVAFSWTRDGDWVADPFPERVSRPLVAFADEDGAPHLVCTDGRGTVVHIETGAWTEAGARGEAARPAPRAAAPAAAAPAVAAAEAEPAEADVDVAEPEAAEPVDTGAEAAVAPEPEEPSPADDDLTMELTGIEGFEPDEEEAEAEDVVAERIVQEPDTEDLDDDVLVVERFEDQEPDEGEELTVDEEPTEGAVEDGEEAPVDFEDEVLMMEPPADGLEEDDEAGADEEEPEPEPEEAEEPEPEEAEEPEPVEDEPAAAKGEAEEPGEKKKFKWDKEEGPPPGSEDVELMDLSLLDTWPETKLRSSGRKSKEDEESGEADAKGGDAKDGDAKSEKKKSS